MLRNWGEKQRGVSRWKYRKQSYGESKVKVEPQKGMFPLVHQASFHKVDRIKRWRGIRKKITGE